MQLIPRGVAFNDNGKAIVAGCPSYFYKNQKVISLPTDHYDFPGPIKVEGKTEEEIMQEVENFMKLTNNPTKEGKSTNG